MAVGSGRSVCCMHMHVGIKGQLGGVCPLFSSAHVDETGGTVAAGEVSPVTGFAWIRRVFPKERKARDMTKNHGAKGKSVRK